MAKNINRTHKNKNFWESGAKNTQEYIYYRNKLLEIASTRFKWVNLPDTINERYLELNLIKYGKMLFFKDDIIGFLALKFNGSTPLNIYDEPTIRRAYSINYNNIRNYSNSVIIYNNYLKLSDWITINKFSSDLCDIQRIISTNLKACKTPVIIECEENQRLTIENLLMKIEGNQPYIIVDKKLNNQPLTAINTGATFLGAELYELKRKIWNEALTSLGILNITYNKKERLLTDEVNTELNNPMACVKSALKARKQAADEINKMFGLNIDVELNNGEENKLNEADINGGDNNE